MFPLRNADKAQPAQSILSVLTGWAFAFLLPALSLAQPTELHFQHLGLAEGLSQSTNGCIYRDSLGFVWIGSAQGLNRFDGTRVKVYAANAGDPRQLADPTVISPIFEDKNHDLWFSTVSAIHCYRRQSDNFERVVLRNEQEEPMKNYQILHLSPEGKLWVRAEDALYIFDTKAQPMQPQPLAHLNGTPVYVFEDGRSVAHLYSAESASKRLVVYRQEAGLLVAHDTLFDGRRGMPALEVKAVLCESNGTLWVCSKSGFWKYTPGQAPREVERPDGKTMEQANQVAAWGAAFLFVATTHGLYLIDKQQPRAVRHWLPNHRIPSSLSGETLKTIHVDRDENLWVSAWSKGIDYTSLRKTKFGTVRHFVSDGSQQDQLFVPGFLLEGGPNQVWAGSQMQGLMELDSQGKMLRDFRALIPDPDQMFDLGQNTLLISHFNQGLHLFYPEKKSASAVQYQGSTLLCNHLCRDAGNSFWIASGDRPGLFKLKVNSDGSCKVASAAMMGIGEKQWVFVEKIGPDRLLAADENYSIYEISPDYLPLLRHREAGYINCSLVDEGRVWIGTSTGLLCFHTSEGRVQVIDHQAGLPNGIVYSIEKTGPDEMWLGTGKGLVRFRPQDMSFQTFSIADGLQSFEFNRGSSLYTREGVLWFGGVGGYNRFRPEAVRPLQVLPNIQIVELQVSDAAIQTLQNTALISAIHLPYDSSTLTVHFAAIEFSDPLNNLMKYRLLRADGSGYDQDWVLCPNGKSFARYANLPPGRYQLQIQAANSDGVWSPDIKTLDITIHPPWWQTTWFYTLAAAALAMAAYTFYRYRLGQLRRRLEQRNRMTLLELDALRAQLNPHFISNSLVAINYYIRNNGVERVRQYVNTLARLMRDVLASARHLLVSVDDELAMLRNYVEVESGQFLQPIDFEINVDEGIPTAHIQMPGMLLQPFVENAIRHGLKPRQGQGKIKVRVERADGALLFTITDDGVGQGQKKPEPKPGDDDSPSRKSHGLDITRKRLQLYDQYQQTASRSGFEITDLQRPDGTGSAGTEVRLCLCLPVKIE